MFDAFPNVEQQKLDIKYKQSKYAAALDHQLQNKLQMKDISLRVQRDSEIDEKIGSSFFMVCGDQTEAAQKYTSLIGSNSKQPEPMLAPNPHDIIW